MSALLTLIECWEKGKGCFSLTAGMEVAKYIKIKYKRNGGVHCSCVTRYPLSTL